MNRSSFLASMGASAALSANRLAFGGMQNNNTNSHPVTHPLPAKPLETESADLTPYTGTWGDAQLRHLLRRTMFGVPQKQFDDAKALGSMSAVLDQLFKCADTTAVPIPDMASTWQNNFPKYTGNATDDTNTAELEFSKIQEVENWWFDQMVKENLSIRQRMTLLWTNHFVTGSRTVGIAGFVYQYLITCMTNALGNFKQFARIIAVDPSMIVYLNGNQNYVFNGQSSINENFARELMELFTLGILDPITGKPNYSETDIQNAARALTGWQPDTYMNVKNQSLAGPFVNSQLWDGTNGNLNFHDTGQKTFLGKSGNFGLDDIINIIFEQGTPAGYTAAHWACQKIYQEFVYYIPNKSVVDAMAKLMVQNNFEIAPVVRALLSSVHFYDANVIGAQIKSPIHFNASLVREFQVSYRAFSNAEPPVENMVGGIKIYVDPNQAMSKLTQTSNVYLGQQLLNPPNVKGWPGGRNWLSAGTYPYRLALSYIFLTNTSNNESPLFNAGAYASQVPNGTSSTATASEILPALEDMSLAFTLGPIESSDLDPNPNATDVADAIVPTFAVELAWLPEFQLY